MIVQNSMHLDTQRVREYSQVYTTVLVYRVVLNFLIVNYLQIVTFDPALSYYPIIVYILFTLKIFNMKDMPSVDNCLLSMFNVQMLVLCLLQNHYWQNRSV